MNLSQLEILVAIVDNGSLTDAAESVGLTQSAVSHSLNRLENELGVTLLERGRGGVSVTNIGQEVVQHARNLLTQAEIIRQKTNRERGLATGKVRFGVVPNISGRLLTGILRDFQHKYPEMDLVLFEGLPQELQEWLATDIVDVAAVLIPDYFPHTMPFVSVEINALLPVGHPLAEKTALTIADLTQYPLIGPQAQYRMFSMLLQRLNIEMSAPKLRYQVSAYPTILTMIREGIGISIMPDMLYDANLDDIILRPFDPPIMLNVHLASMVDSPATLAFMKNTHQWAKEHGFLTDAD